ncbi:MAG: ATP-binding cassette domain-containing protein [Streptosporangiales bacterium]|nr:ATP-binding cassette domain-containing protein [Streptosporangiales bacterium]
MNGRREGPGELEIDEVSLGYEGRPVVDRLSAGIPRGRLVAIVGPNACGKSTLLRGMARLLTPSSGAVLLDGRAISTMPTRQVATRLGILPQHPVAPESVTVTDLVGQGRHPYRGWLRRWSPADDAAVADAMRATDTLALADRLVDQLSGGQRQRAWIAMALAQHTGILLLDEPTTYLDVTHQIEILDLLTDLNRASGATIVMVLHDLNLACRYADHLLVMKDGGIVSTGRPADVITERLVAEVFALDSQVITDPVSGGPLVVPFGRHHGGSPDPTDAFAPPSPNHGTRSE